ncbi:MAG: exodeoxyribonuclease III [Flavobacteriia bacterium]|nr:exodeoxyribonuclease III [Flavobacteriia bacterium]
MKYISWNVNGVRAVAKKGFSDKVRAMNPDILCLQETKATPEQTAEAVADLGEYKVFGYGAERKGYSGTAILSKKEPLNVTYGIGVEEHDTEGRVITAEFEECYVVTTYVPNSGNGLKRLDYREGWDVAMQDFLKSLDAKKPVIWCGDLNVAHQEIDIARPKSNYNKTAGYTQKEIDGMTRLLESGFIDTFREMHPDEVKYSWWSYRGGAREKNIGWRLDYFVISERLKDKVEEAFILNEVEGSDHCPVGLVLA